VASGLQVDQQDVAQAVVMESGRGTQHGLQCVAAHEGGHLVGQLPM
jgi:hypothetical protein